MSTALEHGALHLKIDGIVSHWPPILLGGENRCPARHESASDYRDERAFDGLLLPRLLSAYATGRDQRVEHVFHHAIGNVRRRSDHTRRRPEPQRSTTTRLRSAGRTAASACKHTSP